MLEALALLRRFWWAPVILWLTLWLLVTRATLADVRAKAALDQANAARQAAELQAAYAEKARLAADTYAQRTAAIQPLIVKSIDKVTEYAKTPEGSAPCLPYERVSSILEDRASLFAADPNSGAEPVSSGPAQSHGAQPR